MLCDAGASLNMHPTLHNSCDAPESRWSPETGTTEHPERRYAERGDIPALPGNMLGCKIIGARVEAVPESNIARALLTHCPLVQGYVAREPARRRIHASRKNKRTLTCVAR